MIQAKEEKARECQQNNYNARHRVRDLEPLQPGDPVWVTDRKDSGIVTTQVAPRSYKVATSSGEFCRNQSHLNLLPTPNSNLATPGERDSPEKMEILDESERASPMKEQEEPKLDVTDSLQK